MPIKIIKSNNNRYEVVRDGNIVATCTNLNTANHLMMLELKLGLRDIDNSVLAENGELDDVNSFRLTKA